MTSKALPPRAWSTGDEGSFARRTLAVRVPKILDGIIAHNRAHEPALRALRDEITGGTLRVLVDDGGDDKAAWDAACAPHVGKTWLDIPWYFAESYFYRRVLEATGYFTAGAPGHGRDPYLAVKLEEERTGIPRARALLDAFPRDHVPDKPRMEALLLASLWGNRADLSYAAGLAHGASGTAADLLANDMARALAMLVRTTVDGSRFSTPPRVALLLDNAGTELAFDLVLAHALGPDTVLFAKSHPFFVSDATAVDVERTRAALGTEALRVVAHPYMTSSGFLRTGEMPRDLVAELARFDVAIVKGDANYRRLVGDAPWQRDTAFDDAVDFPVPVLALRTLKAEVAVGIVREEPPPEPDWLVSGKYGVVQLSST